MSYALSSCSRGALLQGLWGRDEKRLFGSWLRGRYRNQQHLSPQIELEPRCSGPGLFFLFGRTRIWGPTKGLVACPVSGWEWLRTRCVCVCERERERERKIVCVCARARFTVGDKVASGKGVSKRHPSKIAKAEHVSKSVSRHVLQKKKGGTKWGRKMGERKQSKRNQVTKGLSFLAIWHLYDRGARDGLLACEVTSWWAHTYIEAYYARLSAHELMSLWAFVRWCSAEDGFFVVGREREIERDRER
jgi:hypothetical protein